MPLYEFTPNDPAHQAPLILVFDEMKIDPCDYPDTNTEMIVYATDALGGPILISAYNEFKVTITLESAVSPPRAEIEIFTTRNELSGQTFTFIVEETDTFQSYVRGF